MRGIWELLALLFRPDTRHAAVNAVAKAQFSIIQTVRVCLAPALTCAARIRGCKLVSLRTLVWFCVNHRRCLRPSPTPSVGRSVGLAVVAVDSLVTDI